MESECLEPLNLVMKKENSHKDLVLLKENVITSERNVRKEEIEELEEIEETKANGNIALLQETIKSDDSSSNGVDQKILTAFYMSSLMQMSNTSLPRNILPQSLNSQHNFVQLLAMVEARQRLWQQMNWNIPPNFLTSPLSLPHPYFDGSVTNSNEQLSNIQNSIPAHTLSFIKHESVNHEVKQNYSKWYDGAKNINKLT